MIDDLAGLPARFALHPADDPQHVYALHYDDGFWATSLDDGTNWSSDFAITFRFQGTDASLKGEAFPTGGPRR